MTAHVPARPLYRPTQWCPNCHAPVAVDLAECPECSEPMPPAARPTPASTSTVCDCCKRVGCDGSLFHCPERQR